MEVLSLAAEVTSVIGLINEIFKEIETCKQKQISKRSTDEVSETEHSLLSINNVYHYVLTLLEDQDSRLSADTHLLSLIQRTRENLLELLQKLRRIQVSKRNNMLKQIQFTDLGWREILRGLGDIQQAMQIWVNFITLEQSKVRKPSKSQDTSTPLLGAPKNEKGDGERPVEPLPLDGASNSPDAYVDCMAERWKRFFERVAFVTAEDDNPLPRRDTGRSYFVRLIGNVRLEICVRFTKAYK